MASTESIRKLLDQANKSLAKGRHSFAPLQVPDFRNLPARELAIEMRSFTHQLGERYHRGLDPDGLPLERTGQKLTAADFLKFRDGLNKSCGASWVDIKPTPQPEPTP